MSANLITLLPKVYDTSTNRAKVTVVGVAGSATDHDLDAAQILARIFDRNTGTLRISRV